MDHRKYKGKSCSGRGPNSGATVVEEYGKCQEIAGRGALDIVRASHRRMGNGAGELLYGEGIPTTAKGDEVKYGRRLTSEFCKLTLLRHSNVMHTLEVLQSSKLDYCEVMQLCDNDDLHALVLTAGKPEVNEVDCYFNKCCAASNTWTRWVWHTGT